MLVERRGAGDCVAVITLNRPKALNALCDPLMAELSTTLDEVEADPKVAAIVITGSEKAFAAGEALYSTEHNYTRSNELLLLV